MGTGHDHATGPAASRRIRVIIIAVMLPVIAATLAAIAVLWPRAEPARVDGDTGRRHLGTVTRVEQRACAPDEIVQTPTGIVTSRCGTVEVRVEDGPDARRTIRTPLPDGPQAPRVSVGDEVVMLLVDTPEGPEAQQYTIIDHQRGKPLIWLALLGALVIVVFGRWRGLAALAGLGVSFAVLLLFVVPAIAAGQPPLAVAVAGSAAIMLAVLYLTHGISVRTSVAVLGTLASLVLTGVLGVWSVDLTHLTGNGGENATTLAMFFQAVDLHGLLLAGIVIGSLGVLDDVTVTQAAAVSELAAADPGMTRRQVYRAATRVGRAHIAAVVNTLVLAYAGASLPVLLLIAAGNQPFAETITSEFLAQEVVRSVVATIGIVAAVPITTALAVLISVERQTAPEPERPAAATPPDDDPWRDDDGDDLWTSARPAG
ncbi:YibE/F family protein [Dactylosporangium sp. NPDC050588]|uniref:YibE/F family protein n=1 Tax=Dactylosporangium sp. NPDC050588 TaxID=3157211 RepID=UPI0033EEF65F